MTSPSAILAPYAPPQTPAQIRREASKSRRNIVALINAVFSVVGVGVAVWKASETTRWTDRMVRVSFYSNFCVFDTLSLSLPSEYYAPYLVLW